MLAHSVPLLHLTSPIESSDSRSTFVNESDSTSNLEAEFTDITKLLMAIPSTGSNDPSPLEFPPDTPIVQESDKSHCSSSCVSPFHSLVFGVFG